jgi:hypothetical protein
MSAEIRVEDRNARQAWRPFTDGATLDELAAFVADMRERGAPGDAHPTASLNSRGEIAGIACVTERVPYAPPCG